MRKGVTFSLIMVLATLTIVEIILVQRNIISETREEYYVKNRINDMNDLYDNIIRDSGKSMEIITKRAISISASHVIQEGVPLSDADEVIEELMLNGTFNNTEELMMENSTISDWSDRMSDIGELKGYNLNLDFLRLEIKPYDSFNILVESDLTVNITDKNGVASITRNDSVSHLVSIEGFEDPVYPLNTYGMVTHTIHETPYSTNFTQLLAAGSGDNGWIRGLTFSVEGDSSPAISCPNKSTKVLVIDDPTELDSLTVNLYSGVISTQEVSNMTIIPYVYGVSNVTGMIPNNTYVLVDGDEDKIWHIENFTDHATQGYYYSSNRGPSFLDRLEGKLYIQGKYSSQTTNTIGLESFINKTDLVAHKLTVVNSKTNIDYLYFSNITYTGEEVKGVDNYFRIDDNHTSIYGVDEILE
ncbi:MAG: hypothetical protein GF368_01230 [Candidatus Aenigmarchaeota archaeon]|nr:hypothetical protein [Candidatus Aenigmarchaeota archaeon]